VKSFRSALEKLRSRVPRLEFMKNKHEDCANFNYRTCKFFHFTNLDPKGAACPHFKAKKQANIEINLSEKTLFPSFNQNAPSPKKAGFKAPRRKAYFQKSELASGSRDFRELVEVGRVKFSTRPTTIKKTCEHIQHHLPTWSKFRHRSSLRQVTFVYQLKP
jgi:hypothetical protein